MALTRSGARAAVTGGASRGALQVGMAAGARRAAHRSRLDRRLPGRRNREVLSGEELRLCAGGALDFSHSDELVDRGRGDGRAFLKRGGLGSGVT